MWFQTILSILKKIASLTTRNKWAQNQSFPAPPPFLPPSAWHHLGLVKNLTSAGKDVGAFVLVYTETRNVFGHCSAPWLQGQCFKFLSCHKLLVWESLKVKAAKILGCFIHVSSCQGNLMKCQFHCLSLSPRVFIAFLLLGIYCKASHRADLVWIWPFGREEGSIMSAALKNLLLCSLPLLAKQVSKPCKKEWPNCNRKRAKL